MSAVFGQVLEVAGGTRAVVVEKKPGWEVWSAEFKGGTQRYKEYFLYLMSSCGWKNFAESVERVRLLRRDRPLNVAVLEKGTPLLKDLPRVRKETALDGVFVIPEFLFEVIVRDALGDPAIGDASELGLEYFVEPRVKMPGSKGDAPALASLARWFRGEGGANVGVLLAPAATGKTSVVAALFQQVAGLYREGREKALPVLVREEQWREVVNHGVGSLEDIWSAALREWFPQAPVIGFRALETWLTFGAVWPLFDGFDELCTFAPEFDPVDVIEELVERFREGGRLLLTSRNRYWFENVPLSTRQKVTEIDLLPFTPALRNKYIETRFPNDAARQGDAISLLDKLRDRTIVNAGKRTKRQGSSRGASIPSHLREAQYTSLDAIPYVIFLATEAVDVESSSSTDGVLALESFSFADPLDGLVRAYCDRERARQGIDIPTQTQLTALEMLAAEYGSSFDLDAVHLVLGMMLEDATPERAERLASHGFVEMVDGQLKFSLAFVYGYLLARVVHRWLMGGTDDISVERALAEYGKKPGSLLDYCSDLVVAESREVWIPAVRERVAAFNFGAAAWRGLFQLLVRIAKDSHRSGPRSIPTRDVLEALSGPGVRTIAGVEVCGSVVGFDLRDVCFRRCSFGDVEFVRCRFGPNTILDECAVRGRLALTKCERFEDVQFRDNTTLSPAARSVVQLHQQAAGRAMVTAEQIREGLREAVRRFRRGIHGFRPVTRRGIIRTMRRRVPFHTELLRALETAGVVQKYEAHGQVGYAIKDTRGAQNLLQNNLALGGVLEAERYLISKLCK